MKAAPRTTRATLGPTENPAPSWLLLFPLPPPLLLLLLLLSLLLSLLLLLLLLSFEFEELSLEDELSSEDELSLLLPPLRSQVVEDRQVVPS